MLIGIISGPSFQDAKRQIKKAEKLLFEGLELRVDLLDRFSFETIKEIQNLSDLPWIFTLRSKGQGGKFLGKDEERDNFLFKLAAFSPEFIDIEYDMSLSFIEALKKKHPKIKIIGSYHNFETPAHLPNILLTLSKKRFDIYKIATQASSSLDALEMLDFIQKNSSKNICGISLGEFGSITRILGKRFGSFFTYAPIERSVTPGQIDGKTLQTTYRYAKISKKTDLLALIGNPVKKSIGHKFFNSSFDLVNKDALYVKIPLKNEELFSFISYAKKLNFLGFSVTMPLKESILPFVGKNVSKMSSINTLLIDKSNSVLGWNTDGIGCLDAIEKRGKVAGKKVAIIGAGGAAKAIAIEAKKRDADIFILNRNKEKAALLAKELQVRFGGLEDFCIVSKWGYDVLINATSYSMGQSENKKGGLEKKVSDKEHRFSSLIDKRYLLPKTLVMDIVTFPLKRDFINDAEKNGAIIIPGYEMYINQALYQWQIWFGSNR